MNKKIFICTCLFIIFIIVNAYSYSSATTDDISKSVLRLHVIANSNSAEDQDLKYKVRDALLQYMNNFSDNISTKKDSIRLVQDNLENFKTIACNVVKENGYDYPVDVKLGNYAFPTKSYEDISFPCGYYDALEVKIGLANGKNWWCVMFPPLCFVDVSSGILPNESKKSLSNELSEEEYSLITDKSSTIDLKFKIIELFQNIKIKLANK